MLEWFRDFLRRWILNEDPRAIVLKSGTKLTARGTIGLHLSCTDREGFPRMVAVEDVADPDQFRTVFRRLGGKQRITWDDGSPADPWSFP